MTGPVLSLDWETRSRVDIKRAGAYPYAEHPTTDILCGAWSVGGDEVGLWLPGQPCPEPIVRHVRDGGLIRAWNAAFERLIWWRIAGPRYGWPEANLEQFVCTAAEAAAMALPRDLERTARVLGVAQQKDAAGSRVMLQVAKPRRIWRPTDGAKYEAARVMAEFDPARYTLDGDEVIEWQIDPQKLATTYAYCRQDVRAEMAVAGRVRALTSTELQIYLLDQRINDRGIACDLELVRAAQDLAGRAAARLNAELREVTGGRVAAATKTAELTRWLQEEGVDTESVAKPAVRAMLADGDVTGAARRAVEIRAEAAKSSTAKLKSMLAAVCADERLRGLLLYHGAGTGRWAGRLVQPHNFPRLTVAQTSSTKAKGDALNLLTEHAVEAVLSGDIDSVGLLYGPPMAVVSALLRACMTASDGHDLIAADFSNIEGRVLAWLAGETWKIKAFRDFDAGTGADLYILAYSNAFGVPVAEVDDPLRQRGKVMELSCGYQGGVGAFQAMAANYGLVVSDAEADRLKTAWRKAHPATVALWAELEDAAKATIRNPGQIVSAARGRIRFRVKGGFLWMVLPSGRPLAYASPDIRPKVMPWTEEARIRVADEDEAIRRFGDALVEYDGLGIAIVRQPVIKDSICYWGVDPKTRQWSRQWAYGGLLTENCLAGDAPVLTTRGWVPLQDIRDTDWLWDGVEWVAHDGVVCNGTRPTIALSGVRMTEDHRVLTKKGWRNASSCEGLDRAPVRTPGTWLSAGPFALGPGRDEPVFDILNAGPRHRFVVLGEDGPFIVHNCVQAIARDLMAEAMLRLETAGYPLLLTVHDEIVAERRHGEGSVEELEQIMTQLPAWAAGCPVAAAGWRGRRYRKG